ncbi:MAG: hypothetical protein K6A92_12515 [Lachnospiraceae bacterium]|nr:hypothetical protein [Lachnospiraceae bacterium]
MIKQGLIQKIHTKGLCAALAGMLLLTGCGSAIPELSEEDSELVSNYAAELLLVYGTNYDSRLVDTSVMPEDLLKLQEQWAAEEAAALAEQKESEESTDLPDDGGAAAQSSDTGNGSTPSGGPKSTNEHQTDLTTALKIPEGMTAEFVGYDTFQSFVGGDNNAFSIVASPGKQLLVVQLNFYNGSGMDQELDFLDAFPNIIARINHAHANSAQLTVLTNDLITYKGNVPAGDSRLLCLVFEISDSITSIESLDLVITISNDVNAVTLF